MSRYFKIQQKVTAIATVAFLFVVLVFPSFAQAAIVIRGTGQSNQVNTGTSVTVTKPTGVVAGDVLIASAVTNTENGDVINPPSGWTQIRETVQGTLVLYTWYKVAGSSEPGSYIFTFPFAKQVAAGIVAYSGVHTIATINNQAGAGSSVVSNIITAPAITTTKPNTMLVATYVQRASPQTARFSTYNPAQNQRLQIKTNKSGSELTIAMADQTFVGPGTAPQRTVGSNKTSAPSIGHVVALRPVNVPPTAGVSPTSINLQYPTSISAMLNATSGDVDGTIVSWSWIKTGGPLGGNDTILSPNTEDTGVSWAYPPVTGMYTYRLTVTDNEGATGIGTVTVTIPTNFPPYVNAGPDIDITAPSQTTRTLNGEASDTQGGPPAPTVLWTKQPGSPAGGDISDPTSAVTDVTGLLTSPTGTYVYRLTATDNLGLQAYDDMQIRVPLSYPPLVWAGDDKTIQISPDQNTVTLNGTVEGTGAKIASVQWTKMAGNPSGDTIVYPIGPITDVTFTQGGTYNYLLTATDINGMTANDTAQVTVTVLGNALPNVVAVANPSSISLPEETFTTLDGRQTTDSNGPFPLSYAWSLVNKPAGSANPVIATPNSSTTNVTELSSVGTYVFRLTVSDAWAGTGTRDVSITASMPAFSATTPVTGVIWASSIGWISLGGANGGNVAVHPGTGDLSGFAWASNIGYINFNPASGAGGCTASPCAKLDMVTVDPNDPKNKKASGWVRACSVLTTAATTCAGNTLKSNSQRGGWDGWIKLYASETPIGSNIWEWTNPLTRDYLDGIFDNNTPTNTYDPWSYHGVYYDDLIGFAWGGMVVGWVDFFGASLVLPVPVLNVRELQLDFGDVWVGTTKDMDFTVENIGDLGSFLRGVASIVDTTYFTCVANCDYTVNGIPVGFPRLVTIRFATPLVAATGLSTQVDFTGINTAPPSSMQRTVLGNAIIPVFGNGLNFGNVVVGRYRELTLTFENAGNINLCTGLSGDSTPCPDTIVMPFAEYTCIPSCEANLAPGVENNIIIRFSPTAVQAFNGDAYLQNNPTVTFPFTGYGVLGTFQFRDQ